MFYGFKIILRYGEGSASYTRTKKIKPKILTVFQVPPESL